jgi:hypothetical protein
MLEIPLLCRGAGWTISVSVFFAARANRGPREAELAVSSPYLDRLLVAAMKRRALDTLALRALMKATHLLGLALAERLRE